MNKNIQDIDELFHQKIEGFEEIPNNNLWDKIENNLNLKANNNLRNKYYTTKKIAAVLLLLLISCIFYINNKSKNNIVEKNNNNQNVNKNKNQQLNINNIVSTNDNNNNLKNKSQQIKVQNTNSVTKKRTNNNLNINQIAEINSSVILNKIDSKIKLKTQKNSNENIVTNSKAKYLSNNKILQNKNEKSSTIETETLVSKNETINIGKKLNNDEQFLNNNLFTLNTYNNTNSLANNVTPNFILTKNYNNFKINLSKIKISKKFAIIVYATPQTTFNRIEDENEHKRPAPNNAVPGIPYDDRHKIKEEESDFATISTGATIQKQLHKNIFLQSGIEFNSQTSYTKSKKVFAEKDNRGDIRFRHNSSFGATYINPKIGTTLQLGDSAIAAPTINTIQFIGIPIQVGYAFTKNKFTIQPFLGITYNFLIKQKARTGLIDVANKEIINVIDGVKKNFINTNFGFQLQYAIKKNIAFTIAPTAHIALTAINKNNTVKSYPNTIGLMTGLQFKL